MLVVNALPNGTIALLHIFKVNAHKLWRCVSVCSLKEENGGTVLYSVTLNATLWWSFLVSSSVSSRLECSHKLVLLLVKCVLPVFLVFIFVLEN
jgi:hypothetical protein